MIRLFYIAALIWPVFVLGTEKTPAKVLVSPNYIQLEKCFPELAKESLKEAFGFQELKDEIDRQYVTLSSALQVRKIETEDAEGHSEIITLEPKPPVQDNIMYKIQMDRLDDKGTRTALPLAPQLKNGASQEELGKILITRKVLKDEKTFRDTKLKEAELNYRLTGDRLEELVFKKKKDKKKLYCHMEPGVGPLCLCN